MWPNYPGATVVGSALKIKKRKENLSSGVDVLQKTLIVVISRRCFPEDGKGMYQRLKHTCTATVLLIKTIVFLAFSPTSSSSLLKVPNKSNHSGLRVKLSLWPFCRWIIFLDLPRQFGRYLTCREHNGCDILPLGPLARHLR